MARRTWRRGSKTPFVVQASRFIFLATLITASALGVWWAWAHGGGTEDEDTDSHGCWVYVWSEIYYTTQGEHITQWPRTALGQVRMSYVAYRSHRFYWYRAYRVRTIYGHMHEIGWDEDDYQVQAGSGETRFDTFADPDMDLSDWGRVQASCNCWNHAEFVKWADAQALHQHDVYLNYQEV